MDFYVHSIKCLILQCFLNFLQLVGLDWIDLVQDRDKWQAVVCTVMNLAYQEELQPMVLLS